MPVGRRTRIYFLHIPKTAGSSVRSWLRERVGTEAACPAQLWNELVLLEPRVLRRYRLFSGHFGWDLGTYVGRRLRIVTVFRDPLARTVSHYRHVRRDVRHPRHARVRRQDFAAFVRDEENWPMIENFQARYLLPSVLDAARLCGRLDPARSKLNLLSTASEDGRYLYDRAYVREVALRRLDALDVAGVTDDLAGFLSRVQARFGLGGGAPVEPRANVAPADDEAVPVDAATAAAVRGLTEVDEMLFRRASGRDGAGRAVRAGGPDRGG